MRKERTIEDRELYGRVMKLAIPLMLQFGLSNLIGVINNIMVGVLGTEQLAGVSIANQLIGIYYLCIFGAVSGAEIFGAQYYGREDYDSVRYIFRYKIIVTVCISAVMSVLFIFLGKPLISLFLHESDDGKDLMLVLNEGYRYGLCMLVGFFPYGLSNAFSSSYKESNNTKVPLYSSSAGLILSVILNYILIPPLGVLGAALATVISRFAECMINIIWARRHRSEFPTGNGLFNGQRIPPDLLKTVITRGLPLILNETFWQIGYTIQMQSLSLKGIDAVAAVNIASTISSLFIYMTFALGNVMAIITGNLLGNNMFEEAKKTVWKITRLTVFIGIGMGVLMLLISPFYPLLYGNVEKEVLAISTKLLIIEAAAAPFTTIYNDMYATLKCGGNTVITFLYDCGLLWGLNVLFSVILSRFTGLGIVMIYLIIKSLEIVKDVIGIYLVKKGVWLSNLTA